MRYEILSVPSPRGEMKACARPPGGVLRRGRTLLVQAGREAVLRWDGTELRLRPHLGARGETAVECEGVRAEALGPEGGVLVGLEGASAFVRVEPAD